MNTTHGEWVRCTKCIYVEDCDTKEDRNGCYFGETERTARWKGAGLGDYYCSLCCEVGDVRAQRCPNCNALMYTDEEYAEKLAEWEAEDRWYKFWNEEVGPPLKLNELLNKKCEYCNLANYSKCEHPEYNEYPHDSEYMVAKGPWTFLTMTYNSKTNKFGIDAYGDYDAGIDIEYCPKCGRKLEEEE